MTQFAIPKKYQRVSITTACEISGKSRSYFYAHYLKPGKVSKHTDDSGKPYIDLSELIRVFGEKQVLEKIQALEKVQDIDSTEDTSKRQGKTPIEDMKNTPKNLPEIEKLKLEHEIENLRKDLDREKEKNRDLKDNIREKEQLLDDERNRSDKIYTDLQTHMRLLEDNRAKAEEKKNGFWSRIFRK